MSKERQLELNFDDPVEHLAPPFYLGGVTYRVSNRQFGATAVRVEIHITVDHMPATPETGRHGK